MSPMRDPLFDAPRRWAYPRAVDSPHPDKQTTVAHTGCPQARRRRSASGPEQARRVAWGKKWGGMMSAFWKAQHAKEANR